MTTIDVGKSLGAVVPIFGAIGAVVVGSILYNYLKQQGWTFGFQGIMRDAGSYPAYGPHTTRFNEGIPGFGPAFSFAAQDPFNKIGRTSQSRQRLGDTFSGPALSNIDRNYERIFYDRFP